MEGENSHQPEKGDQPGTQPQLHCRSKYGKRRLITREIGARKPVQARLSGTVHGTVNLTGEAAAAHLSLCLCNGMLSAATLIIGAPVGKI